MFQKKEITLKSKHGEKVLDNNIRLETGELLDIRRAENYNSLNTFFSQIKDKELLNLKTIKIGYTNIRLVYRKDDKDLNLKLNYLKGAIKILKKSCVDLPHYIRIKMCPEIDESYAFNGSKEGRDYPHIYFGNNILKYNPANKELSDEKPDVVGGIRQGRPRIVADQIHDKSFIGTKKSNRAKACIIHEFAHILHERTSPKKFYECCDITINRITGEKELILLRKTFDTGNKVSEYAQRNPLEFVAEVFTGLVFGKKYDNDIMTLYAELGGPKFKLP